ncbi:cellulose binding domain-containing protein [Glycomyces sp. NPDC049804]|uniref:cellulose binding domain-containing protein n=1 Tax=Glycomyces sp. NPDC049804 TaxID=3154363 RepID=UPI0034139489
MGGAAGAQDDPPAGRGRLHGRLLQVLGGVSAVAAAVALWQFGVFGEDPVGEVVDVIEDPEAPSIPDGASEPSTGAPVVAASVSAAAAPSESTAAPTSEASSSAAPTSAAPSETAAEVEESGRPSGPSCSASLTVEQEWDDSVEVSVEVVNSGSAALASWEVDLGLRDVDIYHYWSMRDLGGGRYGSEDWNARLDPGENAVAGFQAELGDRADLPGSVTCTAA